MGLLGASGVARAAFAALLAFVVAVRLLTPAGFMPAFERGAVTIVACPDYAPAAPVSQHHHGDPKKLHQPCPYAAAEAAGALADDFAVIAAAILFGAVLLFGRTYRFLERHRRYARPPLRGPPLAA